MPRLRSILALLLTFAVSPAFATAEHRYGKREYAVIADGRAPNRRLSVASHGEGEFGGENFHVYLMAEPGHRRLAVLDDIGEENNLDHAPQAYSAAWSPDSRYVAISFRTERHIMTLNLYRVEGRRARLVATPDLFRNATGRAVQVKVEGDMRTFVPQVTWLTPRRFRLADDRLFVEDDAALADQLGALGKTGKMDDGRYTIAFSAQAVCTVGRDGRITAGKLAAGTFPPWQ